MAGTAAIAVVIPPHKAAHPWQTAPAGRRGTLLRWAAPAGCRRAPTGSTAAGRQQTCVGGVGCDGWGVAGTAAACGWAGPLSFAEHQTVQGQQQQTAGCLTASDTSPSMAAHSSLMRPLMAANSCLCRTTGRGKGGAQRQSTGWPVGRNVCVLVSVLSKPAGRERVT